MKKLIFIGYTVVLALTCKAQAQPGIAVDSSTYTTTTQITKTVDSLKSATDSAIKLKVDSAISVAAPSDTKVGPIKLPTWLLSVITTIIAVLPLIQFILKRIPTANSVKIQGWLGIVLDAVTFFQKDKSTAISPSAPPPVQNGIEKPALKDLVNHK